jgi:hypothetical protein
VLANAWGSHEKAKRTLKLQMSNTSYMGDEQFAGLKEALERALALNEVRVWTYT